MFLDVASHLDNIHTLKIRQYILLLKLFWILQEICYQESILNFIIYGCSINHSFGSKDQSKGFIESITK